MCRLCKLMWRHPCINFRYWSEKLFLRSLFVALLLLSFSIHICVTMLHTQSGVAEQFVSDVKREVAIIMKNPKEKTTGMVSFFFIRHHSLNILLISLAYNKSLQYGLKVWGQTSNMLIWCSTNISYYYQYEKMCCLIFWWNLNFLGFFHE